MVSDLEKQILSIVMEYGYQPDIFLSYFKIEALKTSTSLAGRGIWTRDLPNASLVRYHGAISLGYKYFLLY